MKKILWTLALAASMGLAQARNAVMLVEPDRVALASGAVALTPDLVKQAIVRGGSRHGWTVAEDQPGKLRLKFNKENRHEVVVDVSYDETGYLIRYVDSVNMKYEKKDAVTVIHPFYNQWVANLSRAISTEVTIASAGGK